MNRTSTIVLRVTVAFSLVTTLSLAIFLTALWANGLLTETRIAAAIAGLRGAPPDVAVPERPDGGRDAAAARELEVLLAMADARERDLRLQLERVRAEKKAAAKKEPGAEPAAAKPAPAATSAIAAAPAADARFRANLDVLRSHLPKTAAALMADWEKEEVLAYLRAMKAYEAAEILAALQAMGKRGEVDYGRKASELQAELGK